MHKDRVTSQSPFEDTIAFSRAVKAGNHIMVSGTAPISPEGDTACPGDLFGQTLRCLEISMEAVEALDGSSGDVVRTRIYLGSAEKRQFEQILVLKVDQAISLPTDFFNWCTAFLRLHSFSLQQMAGKPTIFGQSQPNHLLRWPQIEV